MSPRAAAANKTKLESFLKNVPAGVFLRERFFFGGSGGRKAARREREEEPDLSAFRLFEAWGTARGRSDNYVKLPHDVEL